MGYDTADGKWASLMEQIVAAEYMCSGEDEGLIDLPKLATAVNNILVAPADAAKIEEEDGPASILAMALEELDFFNKGLE